MHGILDSSDNFAVMDSSIAKYFLERGYQVWLGNNRGNKYSCTNEKLDNNSKEFWDFSFQEMAETDFPLFLETVLSKTQAEKVTVLGHSQGATQVFASLSEFPELQSNIGMYDSRPLHQSGASPLLEQHGRDSQSLQSPR